MHWGRVHTKEEMRLLASRSREARSTWNNPWMFSHRELPHVR